ncbi:Long-chain-fatty-acid--CoA ligase [Corynebacterium pseudopelargi]|uniref:Long-chain-fatty-acid--CoA ligase n=1 Tax=Corynebacterium pseudopelargi TaxID=2080757 RepID=A0A3G6IWV9_9CORY|nr:Long-chain-fatty-acid--CoA ligase [Corynebacterium pseudopelargi]
MSRYTLSARVKTNIARRHVAHQFLHFLQRMRQRKIISFGGPKEILADVQNIRRWGGLEATIVSRAARQVPDRVALIDDDGQLTYKELIEEAEKLARALHQRGCHSGANVAVMALNGRGVILPLIARQMAGFNIFLINGNSSAVQIEEYLDFHDIKAMIVDEEFLERMTESARNRTVLLAHLEDEPVETGDVDGRPYETMQHAMDTADMSVDLPAKPARSHHVLMTSGTTGMPKAVIRRHLKSPQSSANIAAVVPFERNMRVLLSAVLFHAYGWAYLGMALITQSTIVTHRHFDATKVLDDFKEHDITLWVAAATRIRGVVAYMDDNNIDHYEGLKAITNSGSLLLPVEIQKTYEKFGPVLCSMYGSSETTAISTAGPHDLIRDPHLSGFIYPGCIVKIFDDNGNELPDGEEGVVAISSYDLFAGYTDPAVEPRMIDGMYYMGDRGYKKGNRLYILGRDDDLVITQYAEKIYPVEIMDEVMRLDQVRDCFVHGVPDAHTGQALRAYVITKDEIAPDTIREHVRSHLSDAHVPRDVVYVDDFKRGPTGKVLARFLPEPDEHNQREEANATR